MGWRQCRGRGIRVNAPDSDGQRAQATRTLVPEAFRNPDALKAGLTIDVLSDGVKYAHEILDTLDLTLIERGSPRISRLVELANFSSMVGNLLANGIVQTSDGTFERAGPHKYQDLRATGSTSDAENIEIKVALEKNKPKGHLAKAGYYLTCRYVLGDQDGGYDRDQRGEVAWIWELRFGYLEEVHFSISNTDGDSGKTATVNGAGMTQLAVVYFDPRFCPYVRTRKYLKDNGLDRQEALPLSDEALSDRTP